MFRNVIRTSCRCRGVPIRRLMWPLAREAAGELCTIDHHRIVAIQSRAIHGAATSRRTTTNASCTAEAPQSANLETMCAGSSWRWARIRTRIYSSGYWTPARYVTYDGPQPGTLAERRTWITIGSS